MMFNSSPMLHARLLALRFNCTSMFQAESNDIIYYIIRLYTIIYDRCKIAILTYLTVDIVARLAIINTIAVAHIEALLRAVSPDGVLNEPRKCRRKARVE